MENFTVKTEPLDDEYNVALKARLEGNVVYFFDKWEHERAVETYDVIVDNLGRWKFTCADTGKKFILTPVRD